MKPLFCHDFEYYFNKINQQNQERKEKSDGQTRGKDKMEG